MKNMKTFLTTGALLAASLTGSANAAVITVDGVSFDDNAEAGFVSSRIYENGVSLVGETLVGHGTIETISNDGDTTWVSGDNNTELTFTFSYTVSSVGVGGAEFTDGVVTFYRHDADTFAFDWEDGANSATGTEWLNFVGHEISGAELTGTTSTIGTNLVGSALGLLSVDGSGSGSANSYFDTNTADGADTLFVSSFGTAQAVGNANYNLAGTASLSFKTVPEPASFAMLALGGLAMITRRK